MPSSDNLDNRAPEGRESSHAESSANAANGQAQAAWEAYFQTHPWLTCGTAAALGYLLVPRAPRSEGGANPSRPTDSEAPPAETINANAAGESLAKDLLKLAAATAAEQAVAQMFVLGRELLGKSPAAEVQTQTSADQESAAASAASKVDQASRTTPRGPHWVENAIKDLDLPAVEKQLEQVTTQHPITSLLTAATLGLLVGVVLKR